MRQTKTCNVCPPFAPAAPVNPVVGMAVDATLGSGRGLLRGVLRYANARRNWVLHEDFHATVPNPNMLPSCDGVIISTTDRAVLRSFQLRNRFVINCSHGTDYERGPGVCADGFAAGRMAAEHLLGCELKNFAYYAHTDASMQPLEGFQARLAEADFRCFIAPFVNAAAPMEFDQPRQLALASWLKLLPKPIGIFASDDRWGRELAAACRQASIAVPDEVAILGMNNDDLLCESAWPPMSSIEVDFSRIGYLAAQQLDCLLRGETISEEQLFISLPPRSIVRRQSTHLLAVNDPDVAGALAYIREHACGPFTVIDLLRAVPLTRRTLERRFVEKLGRTPHEEITRVRVETAQRLLRDTDATLPKIAERCGFAAPQALNYMFRKMVGETPAAYRRLHRSISQ